MNFAKVPRMTIYTASYLELGEMLQRAREERGHTLEAMARQLHIRPRYLQALEHGELQHLPGDTFVRGYIRRYAVAVELDAEELVAAYERIGTLGPRNVLYTIPERIRTGSSAPLGLVLTSALAAVLLMVVAAPRHGVHMPPLPQLSQNHTTAMDAKNILAPDCVQADGTAWPPCYWEQKPVFNAYETPAP